jgi:hypothetical protein
VGKKVYGLKCLPERDWLLQRELSNGSGNSNFVPGSVAQW